MGGSPVIAASATVNAVEAGRASVVAVMAVRR
jgi:hypothetical protein